MLVNGLVGVSGASLKDVCQQIIVKAREVMESEVLFRPDVTLPLLEDATDVWADHAAGYSMFEGRADLLAILQSAGYWLDRMERSYGKQYCVCALLEECKSNRRLVCTSLESHLWLFGWAPIKHGTVRLLSLLSLLLSEVSQQIWGFHKVHSCSLCRMCSSGHLGICFLYILALTFMTALMRTSVYAALET